MDRTIFKDYFNIYEYNDCLKYKTKSQTKTWAKAKQMTTIKKHPRGKFESATNGVVSFLWGLLPVSPTSFLSHQR